MPPVDPISAPYTLPQPAQVYTLSQPAHIQFAPARLPNDWIRYCRSLDQELSKSEIISAISRETDPQARHMISMLKNNFETVKRTHGLFRTKR